MDNWIVLAKLAIAQSLADTSREAIDLSGASVSSVSAPAHPICRRRLFNLYTYVYGWSYHGLCDHHLKHSFVLKRLANAELVVSMLRGHSMEYWNILLGWTYGMIVDHWNNNNNDYILLLSLISAGVYQFVRDL